jgi:hypothetical protein
MTKIYMVASGEYSDYRVLGLYSTMEKAEYAHKLYNADSEIDEIELDYLPPHPPGELLWNVLVLDNGDVLYISRLSLDEAVSLQVYSSRVRHWAGLVNPGRLFRLWAHDKAHAIKIATEKRREMLAMGTWSNGSPINRQAE